MNAYYARRAQWHDDYMSYTDNESLEKSLATVVAWLEPFVADRSVLEIACGTGNWTEVLSKRARSVLATDSNDEMLSLARSKPYDRDNVSFALADAYALKPMEPKFEAALAAYWYSHIPIGMIPVFMQGLRNCLIHGGRFLFFDMLYKEAFDLEEVCHDAERNRWGKRFLPDGSSYHVLKNFPTEKDLEKQLGPYATEIQCCKHDKLLIWTVTGRMR